MLLFAFAILSTWITSCVASLDHAGAFANKTAIPAGFWPFQAYFSALETRQGYECTIPGGLPCSDPAFCCGPGQHCCGEPVDGCCDDSDNCFGDFNCCPNDAQTCGGKICCESGTVCCSASPSGCCEAGAVCCSQSSETPCCPSGSTCCGDTCCESGEFCERNTCLPAALQGRIARFYYDEEKNGALLRNMCNGMQGENTKTLTYAGKLSDRVKAAIRASAGCVRGYCANLIATNPEQNPPELNSCDEFPFASTLEGGDTLPQIERAINCIPGVQNSHQGGILGAVTKYLQQGDQFVVSVDCEEVLGSIHGSIEQRDNISMSGVPTTNNTYPPSLNGNTSLTYLIVPFGDLNEGIYSATIQCTNGSTLGAFVLDNQGDNLTANDSGIVAGQNQQFSFTLPTNLSGIGLLIGTMDNMTNVTWTLDGTTTNATASSTAGPSPTANSALPNGAMVTWGGAVIAPFVCLMTSLL